MVYSWFIVFMWEGTGTVWVMAVLGLQMVLAAVSSQTSAEVVRNVYKGENGKDVECCAERSQAFS